MKQSRLTDQFPAISADLPLNIQKLLTGLEEKLVDSRQTRVLVQIEASQRAECFLVCMERLLRYTKSQRLLVLTSASSQPMLYRVWQAATSREDGQSLTNQFPTHYALTWPLSEKTRVCISTIRELQLQQIEHLQDLSTSFDIILAYDFPSGLSPVWQRVIGKQQTNYLIAFCENPKQEVLQWFEGMIIGGTCEEDTTQCDCTQRPPAI